MSQSPANAALRQIRTVFGAGSVAGLSDAQLLERFLDHGRPREAAELAFSALVERHGGMVMGVCRRVLRDPHDADDAFQATFLVLVRKARTIYVPADLGPWLFGVALRTAQDCRTRSARRRAKETRVCAMSPAEARREEAAPDLRAVLDEELGRLPERYRATVVLCELQGRSRKEAGDLLGVPEGTVSSRLARARGMLRDRLARRGLALSAGMLSAALARDAAAAVPPALAERAVRSAMQFVAGPAAGAVSASVAALTEGVLKAMFLTKLKSVVMVAVVAGAAATGAGVLAQAPPGPQANPAAEGGLPQANPSTAAQADRLQKLEEKLDLILKNLTRGDEGSNRDRPSTSPRRKGDGRRDDAMSPPASVPPPPVVLREAVPRPDAPERPRRMGEPVYDVRSLRVVPEAVIVARPPNLPQMQPPGESRLNDFGARLDRVERRLDEVLGRLERLESGRQPGDSAGRNEPTRYTRVRARDGREGDAAAGDRPRSTEEVPNPNGATRDANRR